jgi:chemotaxis response regulator CheB
VFVLPADKSITVSQSLLRLSPRLETGGLHHPIDAFLRSLAIDRKSLAIGVILSGSGSDGALSAALFCQWLILIGSGSGGPGAGFCVAVA